MLSQAYYWDEKTKHDGRWFYKTIEDWQSETGLTRRQQKAARHILVSKGFMSECRHRRDSTLWFRVEKGNIIAAFEGKPVPVCTDYRQHLDRIKSLLRERSAAGHKNALKLDPEAEYVDYAAVYARDQGICSICGKLVVSMPGHKQGDLNITHFKPLRSGGKHTAANLRVAHAAGSCDYLASTLDIKSTGSNESGADGGGVQQPMALVYNSRWPWCTPADGAGVHHTYNTESTSETTTTTTAESRSRRSNSLSASQTAGASAPCTPRPTATVAAASPLPVSGAEPLDPAEGSSPEEIEPSPEIKPSPEETEAEPSSEETAAESSPAVKEKPSSEEAEEEPSPEEIKESIERHIKAFECWAKKMYQKFFRMKPKLKDIGRERIREFFETSSGMNADDLSWVLLKAWITDRDNPKPDGRDPYYYCRQLLNLNDVCKEHPKNGEVMIVGAARELDIDLATCDPGESVASVKEALADL
jgi:5-methylcytosine-specific restriction endonuclease McrA